jgi:nucleoside-diphosphate-sugar epimerase
MNEAMTLEELLNKDLDYVCGKLNNEFSRMAGKNLLITGGAGFLGYYLIQAVLDFNKKSGSEPIGVTVFDNYVRGLPDWMSDLESDPNLTSSTVDMIEPLPKDMGDFQFIIHAAGIASPIYYRLHPIRTMDANINGLRNLLDYCLKQKETGQDIEGFLFYSSSEIYGDPPPDQIPTPEDYRGNVSCTGVRACYDESKRYGETLCVNFARQHNLPVKIARPFNNYGPGLKITDRRVLPDFARDVLDGKDIVMYSDGSPRRTFCYIADAIVGYYQILLNGHNGEAYNIGLDKPEISMAELAEKVVKLSSELFDYKGKVIKQKSSDEAYLKDNPNRRCPNIDKAREHLGYNPEISNDEGLKRSLIWYSHNRVAEEA